MLYPNEKTLSGALNIEISEKKVKTPGDSVVRLNIGDMRNMPLKKTGITNFKSRLFVILLNETPNSKAKTKLRLTEVKKWKIEIGPDNNKLSVETIRLNNRSGSDKINPKIPAPISMLRGCSLP